MKLKLGFDEVYVITKNDAVLEYDCIYDSNTADEKVKELKNNGYSEAKKVTLEYAINNYALYL